MESTFRHTAQITGLLLLLVVLTQTVYTGLYFLEVAVPRRLLWGTEGFLFVVAQPGA